MTTTYYIIAALGWIATCITSYILGRRDGWRDGWDEGWESSFEAEVEKPMDCPYCGSSVELRWHNEQSCIVCHNRHCGYVSGKKQNEAEAIAAHNRVCRAVSRGAGKEER